MIWAAKLKERKKMLRKKDTWRLSETYYTTASDLVGQVRRFAGEAIDGVEQGSTGLAFGREGSWTTGGKRFRLRFDLGDARDWLRHQPDIVSHNFSRGHISGERYRPRGEPLSETEKETMTKKEKARANPRPLRKHYNPNGYGSRPLCRQAKSVVWGRSRAYSTSTRADVNCPSCLKMMKDLPPEKPKCEPVTEAAE